MRGKIIMTAAALALLASACSADPGKPSELPAAAGGTAHSPQARSAAQAGDQSAPRPRNARHNGGDSGTTSAVPLPAPTGSDLQQAIATAKAYYAASNYAINTGDTRGLRQLATTGCPCLAIADNIEDAWKHGTVKAPNYYSITSLGSTRINPDGVTAVVNVFYDRGAETHYAASGAPTSYEPPKRGLESVFLLQKVRGTWKIYDLQRYA